MGKSVGYPAKLATGWRRALEQHWQLYPETPFNAALGHFPQLSVT